jgi:hypothetical protein
MEKKFPLTVEEKKQIVENFFVGTNIIALITLMGVENLDRNTLENLHMQAMKELHRAKILICHWVEMENEIEELEKMNKG